MPVERASVNTFLQAAQMALQGPSGKKSVVHLTEANAVTTTAWQRLGKREGNFKEENLEARRQLFAALSGKYGGLENVPKSVRKAMNLGDFKLKNGQVTSCRPLTARRIQKIATALRNDARCQQPIRNLATAVFRLTKNENTEKDLKGKLIKKFGDTPAAINSNLSKVAKTNPRLKACLNAKPMTESNQADLKDRILKSTEESFRKALTDSRPLGFSSDSLRVGASDTMFSRTTINGHHVQQNDSYDATRFKDVNWKGEFSPITDQFGNPNPNASFYGRLLALVPQDDPNSETIMKMVTSQIGLQGLGGVLSGSEVVYGPDMKGVDYGFGNTLDLVLGKGNLLRAGGFSPHPCESGFRDISCQGNEIVVTQRSNFGPQVAMLDGVAVQDCGTETVDVPVYAVTMTIRIPLGQPKVQEGELPTYTCDISVSMAGEDA